MRVTITTDKGVQKMVMQSRGEFPDEVWYDVVDGDEVDPAHMIADCLMWDDEA